VSRVVLTMVGLLSGCAQLDQGFWSQSIHSAGWPADVARLEFIDSRDEDPYGLSPGPLDPPAVPGVTEEVDEPQPEIEMSIEAVLQRTRWGASVGRCQIEVAFRPKASSSSETPETPAGVQILLPEDPGSCAYTHLTAMETADPTGGSSGEDDWELEGTLSGADVIYLHSAEQSRTLHRQEIAGGVVRYELESCTEEDFPFGQIFDLEMPHKEGAAIAGFYMEEALAVGSDVVLMEPMASLEAEVLFHSIDEPLYGVWSELGPPPLMMDGRLEAQRMIFLRNHERGETTPFEALACRPPDVQMTLPPDTLEILQFNPDLETEDVYVAYQVDTVYSGHGRVAPWGQTVFSRSTVSESGDLHLFMED